VDAVVEGHLTADAGTRIGDEVVALRRDQEVLDDAAEVAARELRADDERGADLVVEPGEELVEVLALEIRIDRLLAAEERLRPRRAGDRR
jgi:hypothetical protein